MLETLFMLSSTLQQYYHQSTGRQSLDVGRVPSRDGPCWLCGGGQGGQAAGGDDGDDGGDGGDDEDAGDDVFSTIHYK